MVQINNNFKLYFTTIFFLKFFFCFTSAEVSVGDRLWRISSYEGKSFHFLKSIPSDFVKEVWKVATNNRPFADVVVSKADEQKLKNFLRRKDLNYEVLTSNLKSISSHSNSNRPDQLVASLHDFNYEVYHTYNEIWRWMDLIAADFDKVKKVQIGVTYEGRPIYALITKSDSADQKPTIYFDALAHSREWITTAATMYSFYEILKNDTLMDMVDWVYVPMVNIDGYAFTWTENNRLWRKNRRQGTRLTCDGVDINRNWDFHWGEVFGASSEEPCVENYFGCSAFSEPEARHRAEYLLKNKNRIKAFVTFHSYAQVIIYPYNYNVSLKPDNFQIQDNIANEMSKAMYTINGTIYEHGQAATIMYEASGISTDWVQSVCGIDINFTIELRDTGKYGFILPEDQILPTGKEALIGLQVLAENVRSLYGL